VPFGLAGSFGFDSPLGVVDLPYDVGGDFPALRTPGVEIGALRLDALDLASATLALDLEVDNDHGSTIWLQDFAYAVTLEGTEVGDGQVADFASVDGATTYTVEVPFEVDFLDAGQAVYDAITGGDLINVRLDASTDVTTPFESVVLPLTISRSRRISIE
jgi:LEA14-like dessication related protein